MTMTIYARNGVPILVDDCDFEELSKYAWHISKKGYATRSVRVNGKKGAVRMHRQILGLTQGDGFTGDHINGDRLDNRRSNLRICTVHQNNMNSRRAKTNTSGFKGVTWDGKRMQWRAKIQINRKNKHLGYFSEAFAAHEFYCLAADLIFGEFARYD